MSDSQEKASKDEVSILPPQVLSETQRVSSSLSLSIFPLKN